MGSTACKIDGLFAGESMFHRRRDASKVALIALVERLRSIDAVLLDVQWLTPHLASLGAVEVSRRDYLTRLDTALQTTTAAVRCRRRSHPRAAMTPVSRRPAV